MTSWPQINLSDIEDFTDEDRQEDLGRHSGVMFTSVYSVLSDYRSATVNSKSFVGKVLLRIKWKFELNYNL